MRVTQMVILLATLSLGVSQAQANKAAAGLAASAGQRAAALALQATRGSQAVLGSAAVTAIGKNTVAAGAMAAAALAGAPAVSGDVAIQAQVAEVAQEHGMIAPGMTVVSTDGNVAKVQSDFDSMRAAVVANGLDSRVFEQALEKGILDAVKRGDSEGAAICITKLSAQAQANFIGVLEASVELASIRGVESIHTTDEAVMNDIRQAFATSVEQVLGDSSKKEALVQNCSVSPKMI